MGLRELSVVALIAVSVLAADPSFAAKVGEACGGTQAVQCSAGLWCDPEAGKCGAANVDGRCEYVGIACPQNEAVVCGCNSMEYGNDCKRRAAREPKKSDGKCAK